MRTTVSLILALCGLSYASNFTLWNGDNYPNPKINFAKCGNKREMTICDPENVLTPEEREQMQKELDDITQNIAAPIKFLTDSCRFHEHEINFYVAFTHKVESLTPGHTATDTDITRFGDDLANNYGLSQQQCKNYIIITPAIKDQLIWATVGSDLNLTENIAAALFASYGNDFDDGNYREGVIKLVNAIMGELAGENWKTTEKHVAMIPWWIWILIVVLALVILIVVLLIVCRKRICKKPYHIGIEKEERTTSYSKNSDKVYPDIIPTDSLNKTHTNDDNSKVENGTGKEGKTIETQTDGLPVDNAQTQITILDETQIYIVDTTQISIDANGTQTDSAQPGNEFSTQTDNVNNSGTISATQTEGNEFGIQTDQAPSTNTFATQIDLDPPKYNEEGLDSVGQQKPAMSTFGKGKIAKPKRQVSFDDEQSAVELGFEGVTREAQLMNRDSILEIAEATIDEPSTPTHKAQVIHR